MEIYEIKQKEEKRRRVGKHYFSDIMLFLLLHYITLYVKRNHKCRILSQIGVLCILGL